jgi:hypothetical protein
MSEYRRFAGLKAEVQIRSLLQHVWAETEHDLGYKSSRSVPRLIRRRFARLAGMLEMADAEFVALREELAKYEREVPEQVEEEPASVDLDKASLSAYFQSSETLRRLDEVIGGLMGAKIVPAPDKSIDHDLGGLSFMGVSTIGELETALRANYDGIPRFAGAWLGGSKYSTLYQGISIFYLTYVILAKGRDPARIRAWTDTMQIGAFAERDELVARVIKVGEQVGI